nr:hypothetical protein [Tanacetum cinerariifolium]
MRSSVGREVMNSAKGQRSERDRDGRGNDPRNRGPKLGRPSSANTNVKGERNTKAKLKAKNNSGTRLLQCVFFRFTSFQLRLSFWISMASRNGFSKPS